jgi:hypothetical protein
MSVFVDILSHRNRVSNKSETCAELKASQIISRAHHSTTQSPINYFVRSGHKNGSKTLIFQYRIELFFCN